MEEIPWNACSWKIITPEIHHRISRLRLKGLRTIFITLVVLKFQSLLLFYYCYSTALFRQSFLSFKVF